jgi:hypothetical protein
VNDGGVTRPPFVDEHRVVVPAPADAVWRAVSRRFGDPPRRHGSAGLLSRVLGAEPAGGFGVAESEPPQRLRLAGRHRFSRYVLELVLAPEPGGTALSALTYAEFPGLRGRVYRALVIGSGAHVVFTRRLLRGMAAEAVRRS